MNPYSHVACRLWNAAGKECMNALARHRYCLGGALPTVACHGYNMRSVRYTFLYSSHGYGGRQSTTRAARYTAQTKLCHPKSASAHWHHDSNKAHLSRTRASTAFASLRLPFLLASTLLQLALPKDPDVCSGIGLGRPIGFTPAVQEEVGEERKDSLASAWMVCGLEGRGPHLVE
ncbi:hypothetical protein CALCODRAFT_248044 [Calocera cornea HHB12733]|uniref:Uncharacterized protein n=1 Tax=Calocera cornea HHB12733 TaxID=1353952 RepID=A0A165JVG0_9BASI|nr:hypothetical protein CALCODRAFT_248044 [Calocera cornea HHB12733]